MDELPDSDFLEKTSWAWNRTVGVAGSGPGLGGGLAGAQLWGRLSRSQGRFDRLRCLVASRMNVDGGNLTG